MAIVRDDSQCVLKLMLAVKTGFGPNRAVFWINVEVLPVSIAIFRIDGIRYCSTCIVIIDYSI